MATTYEKAGAEVLELLDGAMRRWHPELAACGVTFDVLMASEIDEESGEVHPTLKLHGYPAAATVKLVPLAQRALKQADLLMTIDAATWSSLGNAERLAVIDHELEHVQVLADPRGFVTWNDDEGKAVGSPKRDDCGRPKLKMKLHDFEIGGFVAIAKRHRKRALEVQAVERLVDGNGQFFWDWSTETRLAAAAE